MSYTLRNDALGGGGASSQWIGTTGYPIYYGQNVGIGALSAPTASLMVTGNIYASNAITTPNVTVSGLTNLYNLQISGVSGTSGQVPTATGVGSGIIWTTPSSGGTSQWSGATGYPIYYVPQVGIGSTLTPTANLMVTGNIYASNALQTPNMIVSTLANIATLNVTGVSNLVTLNTAALYVTGVSNLVTLNVTGVSNLVTLNVTGVSNLVTLNVTGVSNLVTLNAATGYISNIYTSNIQGFTGSQWTGTISAPIYYVPQVGIGSTLTPTANLMVTGNIYASNSLTTPNVTVSGLTNISNLQISGVSGTAGQIVTATGTGSGIQWSAGGGSSQWGGSSGFPIYYGPVVGIGVTGATASAGANLYVQGNVYVSNAVTSYGSYSILNTAILGTYVGGGDISSSTARPINIYSTSYPNFLTLGGAGFYFNEVPLTTLAAKNLPAYGTATAMSADGNTILVTSSASLSGSDSIIYRFTGGTWNSGQNIPPKTAYFGDACDMSADGNTIIITTTDQTANSPYIFRYTANGWDSGTALGTKAVNGYGQACAMSADGNTVIVTGVDSTGMTPYVFRYTAGAWDSGTPLSAKSVSNFGQSCAISANGNTVVVTGYNNSVTPYVYRYIAGAWDSGTVLPAQGGTFGKACAISADGNTIAVTGGGSGTIPSIYRYTTAGTWSATALTAKVIQNFGQSCAMSADGNILLVTGMNAGVTPVIYRCTAGTWDSGTTIAGQLPAFFGQSCAMSSDGNTIVINSKLDTGMTPYVYLLGPRFKVNNTLNVYNYGVGIGSALPGSNLTVIGNIYASNTITTPNVTATGLTNIYNLQIAGVSGTTGQVLAATGTGSAIQWTAGTQWTGAVGTPIYSVPLVGIGSTVTPTANLMVTGNIYVSNTITTPNVTVTGLTNLYNLQISGVSGTTGQVLAATGTGSAIQWTAGTQWTGAVGTPIYYVPRVGIGSTVTPTANLMVTGNVYCSSTQGTSTPDLGTAFFINPTNSANQDISCGISLAGSSARNCYYSYNVTGVNGYSHGISGTSQNLVFKASSDFSSSVIFTMDRLGNFTAAQDISAYSDRRLKKDFKKIEGALDKLSKINGYTFIRTDEVAKNQKQAGVIAQEILEVLPEVVKINEETGYYTVAYGNLTALLIEALKEERQKREELEQRLTKIILDKL